MNVATQNRVIAQTVCLHILKEPCLRMVRCQLEYGLVAPVPDDDAIGVV